MPDPLNDSISSVELTDHMGDDLMVVNAARVSYAKESAWHTESDFYVGGGHWETKRALKEADVKLVRYLAAHNHWTPFGHPQLQFRIKMPIFVAREWYRHTVGLIRNEVSRRYVIAPPEFFIADTWRGRPAPGQSKQGSTDDIGLYSFEAREIAQAVIEQATESYDLLLRNGVAPEMARTILPQSMYTEFIETGSLYAYARVCGLRISPDAQRETRAYAEAVAALIQPLFPVSWEALRK